MLIPRSLRSRLDNEQGVTLVLMCLLLVIMLTMAGLVVNIGLVRADRQRNKSAADAAITAGMRAFDVGGGQIGTFRGACAAIDYLMTNHSELSSLSLTSGWTYGGGTAISGSGSPCNSTSTAYTNNYNTACNPTSATNARNTFAWFSGSTGSVDVTVKAGYSASDMTADNFRDDSYHADTGDASYYGCDQLAVTVTEREPAGFGKVVGANELSSRIRSVGRVTIDDDGDAAVALLLIDPTGCQVLKIGGSNAAVRVKGTDTSPGIIHADSTGAACTGSNRVLSGSHSDGIVAERAPNPVGTGTAGVVSVNATMPNPAYDSTTNVVAEGGAPEHNGPKGRAPVDERYLGVGSAYGMIDLRQDALDRLAWSDSTASTNNYAVVTNCNSLGATYDPAPKTKVFLRCDLTKSVTFASTVTDVVITGQVNLNGKQVVMPNVRNLFIGGQTGNNGKGIDLNSGGVLSINRNGYSTCAARETANDQETTRLVVKSGQLNVGSSSFFYGCGTTVYLMGTDASGTGTLPPSVGTTPADNTFNGNINIGSSGVVDWTAPNTTSVDSVAADWEKFEDLAFWTETSGGNSISGSNASMTLKGIFFTPNANYFDINAGSGGITANAQFITRKLNNQGTATLTLTADAKNSIPIKILSGFSLVR